MGGPFYKWSGWDCEHQYLILFFEQSYNEWNLALKDINIWPFWLNFPGKKTGWRKYERKYRTEWEEQFSWLERAPDQSEMAYCIMCRDQIEPRYNGLVKHEQTVKHKARERGEPLPPGE